MINGLGVSFLGVAHGHNLTVQREIGALGR